MQSIRHSLRSIFGSSQFVPEPYRKNFYRLYADIGWYALLNGTVLSFLNVFVVRQGGQTLEVGIISAAPALMAFLLSIPAGNWLARKDICKATFRLAVIYRLFYLLLIPLPFLLAPHNQVLAIIAITIVMSIPGAFLGLSFNTLFASAVPIEWRGYVVGIRNAISAVITTGITLLSGKLLASILFPYGYVIIFIVGVIGAGLSAYHLYFIKPSGELDGSMGGEAVLVQEQNNAPKVQRKNLFQNLHIEILKGPFLKTLILLCFFYLFWYFPMALFPVFNVNFLRLNDQMIGVGSALFNLTVFFGSLNMAKWAKKVGNQKVTGIGMIGMGLYPLILAFGKIPFLDASAGVWVYILASFIGGFAWSFVGGAMFNYLLEKVPEENRASYLAWYSLGVNACILIGSLGGPIVSDWLGIVPALFIFGVLRALSGLAILKMG